MKLNLHINNKKYFFAFFGIILFLAIFLRFQGVLTNSFPFTYDIGRDLIAAQEIATLQKTPLIGQTTGLPGLFYGPSWHYALALLYHPLHGNPQLITGFINATGVAMVIIAFFLGRKIGGNMLAIVWAGLLATSPAVIALTSQIWNPDLIPIFWIGSLISIYFIYEKRKALLNFFILGVLVTLIIDMEIVVGLLYAAGIALALSVLKPHTLSIRKIGAGLLGGLIVMMPRIIFDVRHENVLSKTLLNGFVQMFISGGGESQTNSLSDKAMTLFSVWAETFTFGNLFFGALLLLGALIVTLIIYKRTEERLRFFINIVLVSLLVSIIGLFLFGHAIWNHYLVIFPLLYITWISLLITAISTSKKHQGIGVMVVLALFFVNVNIPQQYKSFTTPLWEGDASVYRNQLSVIDYVYENAKGSQFKYIVYTPPVHAYTYEYLFDWYGEKKYGMKLNSESKLFFVILEPDKDNPERLKEWLTVRENDGKVIKETEVKGGIIVQTRQVQ